MWEWVTAILPFIAPSTNSRLEMNARDVSSNHVFNPDAGRGTRLFTAAMWLSILAVMYPHLTTIDDKDAMAYLIPLISGDRMQTVGTAYMRVRTCLLPRYVAT